MNEILSLSVFYIKPEVKTTPQPTQSIQKCKYKQMKQTNKKTLFIDSTNKIHEKIHVYYLGTWFLCTSISKNKWKEKSIHTHIDLLLLHVDFNISRRKFVNNGQNIFLCTLNSKYPKQTDEHYPGEISHYYFSICSTCAKCSFIQLEYTHSKNIISYPFYQLVMQKIQFFSL